MEFKIQAQLSAHGLCSSCDHAIVINEVMAECQMLGGIGLGLPPEKKVTACNKYERVEVSRPTATDINKAALLFKDKKGRTKWAMPGTPDHDHNRYR